MERLKKVIGLIEKLIDPEEHKQRRENRDLKAMVEKKKKEYKIRADAFMFSERFLKWFYSLDLSFNACYKNNINIIDVWYRYAVFVYEFETLFPELDIWGIDTTIPYKRVKEIDTSHPEVRNYNNQKYLKEKGFPYDEAVVNAGMPSIYRFSLGEALPPSYWKVPGVKNGHFYTYTEEMAQEIYKEWKKISDMEGKPATENEYKAIFCCCVANMKISMEELFKELNRG